MVVANRLPVKRVEDDEGALHWRTAPGGLVAALAPAMVKFDEAAWLGWTGEEARKTPSAFDHDGLRLVPVRLTPLERELHYEGMSNGTFWPLYHDKIEPPEYHRHWLDGYRGVNRRFAEAAAAEAAENALVWVHDYQLQLVPGMLRKLRPDLRIGFFLHIPFPPPEIFNQLPWRDEITAGLLGADLVGFQSPDDAGNFHRLARGRGLARRVSTTSLETQKDERTVQVRAFPIGIDFASAAAAAEDTATVERARDLRARLGQPRTILLGVDRLDYTKGIDVRLRAFKELLAENQLHPSQVALVQIAEPSRDEVDAYIQLRERVERLVGEINGDFGRVGVPVVHYIHQTQTFEDLLAMYRAADVMLVTPLRDGMNLVAKEYVAARSDGFGSLVLSEFAGAVHQLKDAWVVNPYDINGVKQAIMGAVQASPEETQRRMRSMRRTVSRHDANYWASSFLDILSDV